METFPERAKRARKTRNLTQDEVALEINRLSGNGECKQSTVHRWERTGAKGTTYVGLLAVITKTNQVWLSTGLGDMTAPNDLPEFETLGARLKNARLNDNISKDELSARSGINKQVISDLESNDAESSKFAPQLLSGLKTPRNLEWFLTGRGEELVDPKRSDRVIEWEDATNETNEFELVLNDTSMISPHPQNRSMYPGDILRFKPTTVAEVEGFYLYKMESSPRPVFGQHYETGDSSNGFKIHFPAESRGDIAVSELNPATVFAELLSIRFNVSLNK